VTSAGPDGFDRLPLPRSRPKLTASLSGEEFQECMTALRDLPKRQVAEELPPVPNR
jgi:hypothetical protein